jgi:two-component system, chemotaxis family, protein-glutamate methylesterase/glutaminase
MTARTRVLVVDDTALYRKILGDAVAQIPDAELAGSAASGPIALKRLAQGDVDLVLLDVVMPEMDGVQTLAQIRKTTPHVAVVLVSGVTGRDADVTVAALAGGALEFIPKPQASSYSEAMQRLVADLRRVLQVLAIRRLATSPGAAAAARPPAPRPRDLPSPASTPVRMRSPRPVHLILIGVSTGGPKALHEVLPCLPSSLPVPLLIVQHMPPLFTRSLAEQLMRVSRIPVNEAADGETLRPGRALIAPGGRHLTVALNEDRRTLRTVLSDAPPVHSCRPSVDVLFQSVARSGCSCGIATVILTGMGEDGADGVAALRPLGAWSIAQDQATSVVYGMPEAIARRQLADEILPLPAIGPRLASLPFSHSL